MRQTRRNAFVQLFPLEQAASLFRQGSSFPYTTLRNRYFCTGGNRFLRRTRSLLADHEYGEGIEGYAAEDLTVYQQHARLSAFYLATRAATMPSTRKEASAASSSKKASQVTYKRKRKPGEARYYAVRAGRIPGVYTTWEECQQMINGFAGAQCKYLMPATQRS